eukprot:TRINITY_DN14825_c0_g1_i1.p1 TRINITY_DN14825_c0_g1~~TRINITY_DN14825_c0_g1_i1.p1  ORF type:complete len:198 (-),score=29.81 TRINITY_DN14825_c0_g1_i1:96-689(-)
MSSTTWTPCSVFSPLFLTKLKASDSDRKVWEIRKFNDEWQTIFGNTGLTSGVHYWETKIVNFQNSVMFGLLVPPEDSLFNVDELWSYLGNSGKKLLGQYSLSYYLQPAAWNYAWGANRGEALDLGTTSYNGARIGLKLDLNDSELHLYFYGAANSSDKPDRKILLATLLEGRTYYPAWSLHYDETVLEVTTSLPPPA